MNLKYFMPTKVLSGKGCIKGNAHLMRELGSRALIVTGKRSAKLNGSQRDLEEALKESNISYFIFDKIESNPSIESVRQAAAIAKEKGTDFIIGCGGGSPMDAAKATAVLATNNLDDTALFSNLYNNPPLPVVAVPTTAGTGSEVTQYSILTNDKMQTKVSIASEAIFPRIAFLDASYTECLPISVTVNTAIDALSHALEGFLSVKAGELSNVFSAESMKIIGGCLDSLKTGIIDFDIREKLLYASMLAGIVIAHTGTTALHSMGYSLTYFKDIDHGRANGLLMCEYLQFVSESNEEKVLKAMNYLGFSGLQEFRKTIDDLLKRKEPISESEIKSFACIAIKAKNIANTLTKPKQEDLENIIRKSFL